MNNWYSIKEGFSVGKTQKTALVGLYQELIWKGYRYDKNTPYIFQMAPAGSCIRTSGIVVFIFEEIDGKSYKKVYKM